MTVRITYSCRADEAGLLPPKISARHSLTIPADRVRELFQKHARIFSWLFLDLKIPRVSFNVKPEFTNQDIDKLIQAFANFARSSLDRNEFFRLKMMDEALNGNQPTIFGDMMDKESNACQKAAEGWDQELNKLKSERGVFVTLGSR
ncbi:MAG: hypothetical protein K1X28_10115 [Parachlamydiales bacterium]|nr:hypothetical protein [Parachlamydiales bacterium]